jgi:hypothetical protein
LGRIGAWNDPTSEGQHGARPQVSGQPVRVHRALAGIFGLSRTISVNAVLGDLQTRGIITLAERRDLAREWTRDYVRGCLPAFYRKKNAEAVDRLGWFLKAS